MYHGEGLMQAKQTSADSQRTIGAAPRLSISIPGMTDQAEETQKFAVDRLMSLDGLAGRATNLAVRLAGPFPLPDPDRGPAASGEKLAEPSSALDALQRTISDIRRPLVAMNDPFERLAAALEAMERALN